MMLRTALKSTHTEKDNEWKCKQIIDYLFSPLRTHDEIRRIQNIIIADIRRLQRAANKHKDVQHSKKPSHVSPEAQYEKCNKIINAIFGEQKPLDSGRVSDTKSLEEQLETALSTTAKQTEEQLAQKVEFIDETPLVEAEKPKIEGFNAPPRVLGQNLQHHPYIDSETAIKDSVNHKFRSMVRRLEHSEIFSKVAPITRSVVNYSSDCSNQGGESSKTSGEQDEYDSIAKRHLNTPNNELDNNLIKEMQKLSVPQGSDCTSINIRRNSFKKPRKPSANDIELEARKCDQELPADSIQEQCVTTENKFNIKSLLATPASRLHEEGIRYVEQTTSSSEVTKEEKGTEMKKSLVIGPQKLASSQKNNKNDLGNVDQQAAQSRLPSSQALTLLPQLCPWSFKHISFKDLSAIQHLAHSNTYMYTTERRPPYDPHKSMDKHDKKNIPIAPDQNKRDEKGSELVPNYEGLKLNRDKPYYEKFYQSNLFPSHFYNYKWLHHEMYDNIANIPPHDINSPTMYFSRNMPYYCNERLPFSGTFHQQNMWSNYGNCQHSTDITEQNESEDLTFHGMHFNRDFPYYFNQGYQRGSTSDTFEKAANIRPAEQSQGPATIAKDHLSNEHTTQNAETSTFYNNRYPWRTDFPHNPNHGKANADAHIDNIMQDQETDVQDCSQIDQASQDSQTFPQLQPWMIPFQYSIPQQSHVSEENNHDGVHSDDLIPEQHTSDPSYEQESLESEFSKSTYNLHPLVNRYHYSFPQDSRISKENIPDDTNPDNIFLDHDAGTQSYDESQQRYHWNHTNLNFQKQEIQIIDDLVPVENPANIFLEHVRGDLYNEDQQLHPYTHSQQYSQISSNNVIPVDENPDHIFLDQNTGDSSNEYQQFHPYTHPYQYSHISSNGMIPLEENQDLIFLEQNTGDPSYGDQQEYIYTGQYHYSQVPSNGIIPVEENPDHIFLDQNTNDSCNEDQQEHLYTGQYQYSQVPSNGIIPVEENPDHIFLDQNTSDALNEDQQLCHFTHPYQYPQVSLNKTIPGGENPNHTFLYQNKSDTSNEESAHCLNEQFPNFLVSRAIPVEQLQTALYAANPAKCQPDVFQQHFSSMIYQSQGLYSQNQDPLVENQLFSEEHDEVQNQAYSLATIKNIDRRPPCDINKPILDQSHFEASAIRDTKINPIKVFDPQPEPTQQIAFSPNLQSYLQTVDHVTTQTPYFYHQSCTYFGEVPKLHYGDNTIPQHPDVPAESDQEMIIPDQKTPILAMDLRPCLSTSEDQDSRFQLPAAPSAGFISMPEVKSKHKTWLEPLLPEQPIPNTRVPIQEDNNLLLSEVLKRVRRRSRQEFLSSSHVLEHVEGKCGERKPACPPPQPTCPPPPPPCPPPPPPCPRPCKPKCPPPCSPPTPKCPPPSPTCPPPKPSRCKFRAITSEDSLQNIFTVIWDLRWSKCIQKRPITRCHGLRLIESPKMIMPDGNATQSQLLGNNFLTTYGSALGSYCWKFETFALARGFEPWVPVPSWPVPTKNSKKPYVCPNEGCKQRPPPRYGDPCGRPCDPGNPCQGFPNKYRKS